MATVYLFLILFLFLFVCSLVHWLIGDCFVDAFAAYLELNDLPSSLSTEWTLLGG
jgi:Zn-dependent protease with chaperone function